MNKILGKILREKPLLLLVTFVLLLGIPLSYMRSPKRDETYYLAETMVMSETIKQGLWFGNYAVGLHGFIFKLPVAIIFLITGPSVFIATYFNFILNSLSVYLFFIILKKHFNVEIWAFFGALLLATSSLFIDSASRFLRETPNIFVMLLLVYSILEKKPKWIIGVLLCLLLDSKEYSFLIVLIPIIIWMFFEAFTKPNNTFLKTLKEISINIVCLLSPSLLFLTLSFYTSIIPINMMSASMLGLTSKGMVYQIKHFLPSSATAIKLPQEATAPKLSNTIEQKVPPSDGSLKKIYLILKKYLAKMLSPAVFSMLSIPKVIVVPSIFMAFLCLIQYVRNKEGEKIILPLILFSFLLAVVFRASNGRYFFPATFFTALYFILFIVEGVKRNVFYALTIATTIVVVYLGWGYENKSQLIKIFLESLILLVVILIWVAKYKKLWLYKILTTALFLMISFITISTYLAGSLLYSQGQVNWALKWRSNLECKKIVNLFDGNEKIWLNDIGWYYLPNFYRKDTYLEPEWIWKLPNNVPKKHMLKTLGEQSTYVFNEENISKFKTRLAENNVRKLGLIYSTLPNNTFPMQNMLAKLKKQKWLKLEKEVSLYNKTIYIFSIKNI
jgi:hypothetical protein